MYFFPFPNMVLDGEFRWPEDGLGELGGKVCTFQLVLVLHGLAAGLWFSG